MNKNNLLIGSCFLMIVMLSAFIFYYAFVIESWQLGNRHEVSDFPTHVNQVLYSISFGRFPAYTIWYKLVHIVSGFSVNFNQIAFASIVLLSPLVGAKFLISYFILESGKPRNTNKTIPVVISFLLLFVMPLVTYYTQADYPNRIIDSSVHIYLGNIAPNQWHSSTLILAMPFYLLWFYYSIKHLNSHKTSDFLVMAFLATMSTLCKPNFTMAFLPVFCMALFLSDINKRSYLHTFAKLSLLVIPSICILAYQWYFTFVEGSSFLLHPSKTIFAPLLVWRHYSPHVGLSALVSLAFPLTVLVLYRHKIDIYLGMAWLTFLTALLLFILFATYPNYSSADYEWASIAANYILFLFSVRLLLEQVMNWKAKIAYGVFLLHFFSGCFLLFSFFTQQTSLRI